MTNNEDTENLLSHCAKVWRKLETHTKLSEKSVFIGYDGFIDSITHVVDKRTDTNNFKRIETISDMATRIQSVAGLSTNIELVPQQQKIGGNGIIMAQALQQQDCRIYYAGALGEPQIHNIFDDFTAKCTQYFSLSEPGYTEALEFSDGKILLGKPQAMNTIHWNKLVEKCPKEQLTKILETVSLISFNNWTMLYEMNSILDGIFEILTQNNSKPTVFIDLADPEKRTKEDILTVLQLLSKYATITPVILSMNEKESATVSTVLGCFEKDLCMRAKRINEVLNITHTIIHPIDGAYISDKEQTIYTKGPYTPTPKLTTGAGDNFNAGYCSGYLRGFSPTESLIMGVYTSGFYVRNGYAPSTNELINFIKKWK